MARNGRPLPQNVSKPVDCDLPGYEGVSVTYIVSQTKRAIEAVGEDFYGLAALIVNEVPTWPFEVDPPKHGDTTSFEEAVPVDLLRWLVQDGYQKAMQSSVSPN